MYPIMRNSAVDPFTWYLLLVAVLLIGVMLGILFSALQAYVFYGWNSLVSFTV